jgi:16S rRNA C967 or C1407 C5-methylase (RsmB/RsmF family)
MAELLGEHYSAFAARYEEPGVDGLRVNELKVEPQDLVHSLPADLAPPQWCPTSFAIRSDASLGRHPYHAAGLYYLQEPSAIAVAQVLAPQPGERVLDLCAAPGEKATHTVSLIRDQGLPVESDAHSHRAPVLSENLERRGTTNAAVLNETPHRLARHFPAFYDRVPVDAPCSAEEMFRRSE